MVAFCSGISSFAKNFFDWDLIGRIRRQVAKSGANRLYGFPNAGNFVTAELVGSHDAAGCKVGQRKFWVSAREAALSLGLSTRSGAVRLSRCKHQKNQVLTKRPRH